MKKKFLYSLLFVILGYVPLSANSEAPIPLAGGDNCANATLITCGTSLTGETTVGATNDPFPTCNTNGSLAAGSPNVWYTFVATSNSTTVTTCDNTNFDSEIGIFSGTCGSLVCVAGSDNDGCGTSDETVTFATTVGATYYIMIQGHGGATGTFSLSLTCTSVVDPCSSITPLSCGTPVSVSLSGSGSWNISSCGFSTPGQEKLYSFTATTTGAHTLAVTSTNGSFVDYFFKDASGGCSSTGWTCIDDISAPTNVNFNLTAGVTYYILVDDENAAASSQTFQINCPAPVADPCASITPLSCGTPVSVSLSGSGSWNVTSCGFSTTGQEKVYSFTAATTGAHTLAVTSTNNTFVDYFFKDASGGCSATGWTCIDDISAPTNVNFNLTAGVTYYILADDENATASSQTFQINCPPSCPDLTASAPVTQVTNSTCNMGGGTPSGGSITAPVGTCPANSTLQYSTDNGANWSTTVPTYDQDGPAQTILTRCNCNVNTAISSPTSSVTTVPGTCGLANDLCANAQLITSSLGQSSIQICGTTNGASADNPNGGAICGTSADAEGLGVWYTFVGTGNTWNFSFPEGAPNWDPEVNVYSGTCGVLTCVGGADDSGLGLFGAQFSINTVAGTTYFMYVHAASLSSTSDFCFTYNECPNLTTAAPAAQVTNSTCTAFGGTPSGGFISAPAGTCPLGSSLQYSTDNGANWSATIPMYNQAGPAQTILTRCNCIGDNAVSSTTSSVTTVPGVCPICPVFSGAPANVTITNSTCQAGCTVGGGNITAPSGTPCPMGSSIQYSVNGGMTWSGTVPTYNQTGPAQSIQTRCSCTNDPLNVSAASTAVTTVPGVCTPPTVFNVTGSANLCTTDNIGAVIGVSGSQTGVNYQLVRGGVTNVGAPVAGTGNAISFPGQLTPGTYTVVATNTTTGCVSNMNGNAVITTFNCVIPTLTDPCSCLNNATTLTNGQFGEQIKVNAPSTQTWTVSAVSGLYKTTSPNPPASPSPITVGTVLNNIGGNMFTLDGRHIDAIGYSVSVTNGAGTTLTISNTCAYPNPAFTADLSGPFCLGSDPVELTGTPGDLFLALPPATAESFTVNGNPATQFDPSAGLGQYVIVYTVNGGAPKANGPSDPGCIQSISQTVQVISTPTNMVCNDNVHITLDESCSLELNADQILEGTYGCYDDYTVELDRTLPLGNGPWQPGILGPSDVHHTYAVKVTHISGNSCWGTILVEDKLPPVLQCPCTSNTDNACTYTCADKDGILNGSIVTPAPVAVDGCEGPITTIVTNPAAPGANLYKKDVFIDGGACGVSRIERTWTAKDSWGNSAQCTQVFYLEPYDLDEVNFPEDITIECAGCGQTASTSPCVTGVPTVDGNDEDGVYEIITYNGNCQIQSEGICNLGAQKDDVRIQVCPGTFKILRHWTVLDWCTNTFIEHDQLIKVVDSEGPAIATPGDMTVSTNPSQCCATVNLPDVIVEDACSATANISAMVVVYDQYLPDQVIGTYNINGNTLSTFPGNNFWDCDTLGRYGITPCLPIGHHQVMYMAEDVCGNTNQISFWLTVVDDVAPVATCTQFTTVAIGVDDPTDCYEPTEDCQFGGVTWVPASAFDQGSHDNCSPIEFTIRRMPEADGTYSDCIDGLAPLCDGYEYNVATTENDSIKFYCCEVGTTQTVILRVYQLDINGNRDYYRNPDGSPLTDPDGAIQYIYNECMINVEVQDKIKPTCQAPAPVTINCENFEPSLWAYGYPSSVDNCCLDQTPPTSADPQGQVGIPSGTTAIPGVCGMTQKTYYSGFLNANFDTTCNRGTIIRRFTAWDCQGFSSSCTQRIVVTNTQDYDIVFPADKLVNCVTAPDFGKPVITNDEGCELIGTSYNDVVFTIVPDACYKIERTWRIINWCTYLPDNPCVVATRNATNPTTGLAPSKSFHVTSENCVTYKQIIKVIDQTPPTVTCADIDTCDYSTNNPRYWNYGDNWWDNGTMQHDLCEKSTNISVSAEDFCDTLSPTGGLRFRYLLFLDLDGDQIMETVVSSADAVTRPLAAVLYGNYNTALYHGGVQWLFDNTSTANQKYRFDIEQTANGARVIWRNAAGSVIDPELAHGRHKIKWIAEDGCGNEAVCEKTFEIRDCKPPVVACANVNINLMIGGMATLWASDFFLYGDDNCTPDPILDPTLAIIRADENPSNTYPGGAPANQSVVITCDDLGTLVPVQVWLQDAAGNADFCIAYVDMVDNVAGCGGDPTAATVAGALATETLQSIEQVSVEMTGTPNVNVSNMFDGNYAFHNVPQGASVVVTPTKDDNPLNGVTTYDLVLISKHILGLEPLTTPYKMIAADANRSGSITTFDIVEFRKLILGIYNELPNNTSWRFVDKGYSFPNPANPFQTQFPENISLQNLQANHMDEDFVGVKVGDVNASVIANSLQTAEERTASTMLFDVEDRAVKAGETFTVNFKGAERVQGYQFTMNLTGLEVMDIAGSGDIKAQNFGVFDGAITTSVDGADNEFAITFRASKAGQLSSMLGVSSRITKAEAYSLANNRMDVAFRFNGQNGATISGVGFELYQNQPNPFVNKTFIGFHLPEAADATLRIFDETGRMVFTQSGSFAKGYNTISVDRQLLNTVGVLYYTLETATDSATKKMIQSK